MPVLLRGKHFLFEVAKQGTNLGVVGLGQGVFLVLCGATGGTGSNPAENMRLFFRNV
jgi:hypothetical protein